MCAFGTLADLRRDSLERWLAQQTAEGMGARTRNSYLCSALAFCNWCIETGWMTTNPFVAVPRADEKADPRRKRRAMTEPELVKLLSVTRERPLLEALTVRRGSRKGERYADVRPEVRERLERLGRERALIYKTLVLSGLRKGELTSLTVAHLHLDDDIPYVELDAADEKNREGSEIAIRDDLAADLRSWLADKLQRIQGEARSIRGAIPVRLPPDTPVFDVPNKLSKILNRDSKMADIPKRDDRSRTLDVHALRTTFDTLMSKGGVAPRTTQVAMRHSDIKLTMGVYTDPRLRDVRGALDALPTLRLDGSNRERATGTFGIPTDSLAPTLDNPVLAMTSPVKMAGKGRPTPPTNKIAVSGYPVNANDPLTSAVSGSGGMGAKGFEPLTPSVSSKGRHEAGGAGKGVTSTSEDACTTACTSEAKSDEPDPIAAIAAALLGMSPADCARLAALLIGQQSGSPKGSHEQ